MDVSGKVSSIDKDAFNNTVVRLNTANGFMNAMARIDDVLLDAARKLKKGQSIALSCVGGDMVVGESVTG